MWSLSDQHSPRRLLFVLVAIALLACVVPTTKRGYAAWLYAGTNNLSRVRTACKLEPADPECAWILAEFAEDQPDELAAWNQAARLNSRSADVLCQAALIREMNGDVPGAERLLLQAEEYNHLWLPRWSLANFYVRREKPATALKWARLALERAYGDRRAGFRLCRQAGASDQTILNDILGSDEPQNLSAFLYWIAEEGRLDVLDQAAPRYLNAALHSARTAGSSTNPAAVLSDLVETLLLRGHPAEAHWLWERLLAAQLLPVAGTSANEALTNPTFAQPANSPPGFAWRLTSSVGIDVTTGDPPGGIRFALNGSQPEEAELIAQAVDLEGSRSWTMDYEYQASKVSSGEPGLQWVLTPWGGSEKTAADQSAKSSSAAGWTHERYAWRIPEDTRFFRLALILRRLPGQTRIEGTVQLRKLHLSPAPSSEATTR